MIEVDKGDAARWDVENAGFLWRPGSVPERLEARPCRSVFEHDRGTVDGAAGRDRPFARVLDGGEHPRRAGAAGRLARRLLRGVARSDEAERERSR